MDFNINRNFMIDLKKLEPMARGNGPIIVVDDNEDQLLIIKICYSKAKRKNQLICFTSGDTFLSYLTEKNKNLSSMPSLVLLDINMPGKNGFQVLEEIRSRDEYRDVPIIIMFTASVQAPPPLHALVRDDAVPAPRTPEGIRPLAVASPSQATPLRPHGYFHPQPPKHFDQRPTATADGSHQEHDVRPI